MSSSQSSPSRPPPKWRSSLSKPKRQPPATSVSLIFAQPEQGSRLGSAIDQLPAAAGIDDAASFMSQASRKRERTFSQASSFVASPEQRPEHGAPQQLKEQDATDASHKRSKLSVDVPKSTEPTTSPAPEGLPANAEGSGANPVIVTESPQSSTPSQEPPAIAAESKDSDTSSLQLPAVAASVSSTEPQKTIRASKSTPTRSSWFSFASGKGADNSSNATPEPDSTTLQDESSSQPTRPRSASSAGADRDRAESSDAGSTHTATAGTPPQAIPSSGKPTSPLSFTSTQYSPPNHRFNSNTTSISSVDEEVPQPRFTSLDNTTATLAAPQVVVNSQDAKTAERKPSISSLNPSTSRFMLKLPLLGRPKVPLEHAVAVAQSEDIREPADSASEASTESPASVAPQETTTEPAAPQPPSQPDAASTESTQASDATKDDSQKSHEARAASWWDYVGWSASQAEAQVKASEDGKSSAEQGDAQPPTSPLASASEAQPSESAAPQDPPAASQSDTTAKSEPPLSPTRTSTAPQPQPGETAPKASSVFSADTVRSHASVWYSPWAWYNTSPAAASSGQGESSDAADKPAAESQEVPKTESEMVKEEALARDQAAPSPEAPKESEPSASGAADKHPPPALESPNPVESSIAANRSGWMSFLMSKTLTVKSVANESHDEHADGMEVMEIDDAPEPSAAIEIPTGNDVQRAAAASSLRSAASPVASSPVPSPTPKTPAGRSPTGPPPKEREPRKPDPPAEPLTENENVKRDATKGARDPSPTPSKASGANPPSSPPASQPNFVLPTWEDTFHTPPRSYVPPRHQGAKSKLTGALSYVAGALFSKDDGAHGKGKGKGKGKEREVPPPAPEFLTFGQELPKAFDILGEQLNPYMLNGGCRVAVIGVAGWSPGAVTRTLAGGLPSSSSKFVDMTAQALERFADEHGFKFKKITRMPLEGDGTIRKKVSRVYNHLVNNEEWMEDLHAADVIFVASHSQGAVISTHLVDRLIDDGHILTARSVDVLAKSVASLAAGGAAAVPATQAQKVCLLALCGIHLGPLRYLKTSSLLQPYIQYVENPAARELFEFQDTESKLSKNYIGALRNVMDHGAKVVYIASLNDQVVPIYSGLFTAASHPRILRALYIDNDAYHSSDFLSNLLILLIRILNAGLSDRGLLAHLSEATAGTLSGVGHSSAYEEPATYSLAVKYFFMTNDGTNADAELVINPFNAVEEQNDYEIPWLLRDMIADSKVAHFFAREFSQLRDAFDDWQPKTTILKDVKKKLQPITRLSTIQLAHNNSMSKL